MADITWTEPTVSREHRGFRVHKTGPWGQGPALLQALALLDGRNLKGASLLHATSDQEAGALRDLAFGPPIAVIPPARLD